MTKARYKRKSWREKLRDKENYPKILKLEENFPCYNAVHKMGAEAGDKVVLVNPSEVVEVMRTVSKGHLTTTIEICKKIAEKHRVKACCSLTAGIFVTTAANAAEEAAEEGKDLKIPYWRTLKSDGYLNDKFPGGQEAQKEKLESEGFRVVRRGKKYQIQDYGDFLAN